MSSKAKVEVKPIDYCSQQFLSYSLYYTVAHITIMQNYISYFYKSI